MMLQSFFLFLNCIEIQTNLAVESDMIHLNEEILIL